MTPKKIKKARRIIARPWYNHFRAWKMHKHYQHWDEVLLHSRKIDNHACQMLLRFARKEAWYIHKGRHHEKEMD